MDTKTSKKREYTKEDIENRLKKCVGKTLGEVDSKNVFARAKKHPKITGIAGDVIEQSVLEYPPNTEQKPDLCIDGVDTELKTTGLKEIKKAPKYSAKEPMSITAVSPRTIINENNFCESTFYHKIARLLLVYYLYKANRTVTAIEYQNFPILGYNFFKFDDTEIEALKNDWILVRDFIKSFNEDESQYPRISHELRSKLLMIDTAPKWPNPPRFRLKQSVVTVMARKCFGEKFETLLQNYTSYDAIDNKCKELVAKFKGQTISQLMENLGIQQEINSKSIAEYIIVRLFGGKAKKMQKIELFSKIGLIGKSLVVTQKGTRTEDMKLFPIDFEELSNVKFEESSFYNYFANYQFLYIIFEEPNNGTSLKENKLLSFKRLYFSQDFIENEVKPVWEKIRSLIKNKEIRDVVIKDRNGDPIRNKNGTIRSVPNFPKSSDRNIFVRGSGRDSNDKNEEVCGIKMLKQYIWIKGTYIVEMLKNISPIE